MSEYFVRRADGHHHHLAPGVDLATLTGEHLTLSVVRLAPGAEVPHHAHPHEQLGILLEGELDFVVGEQRRLLQPGDMWRIPGNTPHQVTAGADGARAVDVFHPVREDYR